MAEDSIQIDIVTPNKTIFSGKAERISAPSVEGYFEVLANHAPVLTALKIGKITITQKGSKIFFSVSGGFVEVFNNNIKILAETAESNEEVDTERTEASKERALKRISDTSASFDVERAKVSLIRALNRLSVAKAK